MLNLNNLIKRKVIYDKDVDFVAYANKDSMLVSFTKGGIGFLSSINTFSITNTNVFLSSLSNSSISDANILNSCLSLSVTDTNALNSYPKF